jgi:hypothetical protein
MASNGTSVSAGGVATVVPSSAKGFWAACTADVWGPDLTLKRHTLAQLAVHNIGNFVAQYVQDSWGGCKTRHSG